MKRLPNWFTRGPAGLVCRVLVLSGVLVSCATETPAQIEMKRVATLAAQGMENSKACFAKFRDRPKYTRIRELLPISPGGPPSSAQLADTRTPTSEDIANMLDWLAERSECVAGWFQDIGRIDPDLIPVIANSERAQSELLQYVIANRGTTIGQINARLGQIGAQSNADGRAWAGRVRSRLENQHKVELAEQQAERQKFIAEIGEVTLAVAEIAVASVAIMAQAQVGMASARQQYVAQRPAYVPTIRQTVTNCRWVFQTWTCTAMQY